MTSIRASPGLASDYYRLHTAADLLGTGRAASPPRGTGASAGGAASARRRIELASPLPTRPYTAGYGHCKCYL